MHNVPMLSYITKYLFKPWSHFGDYRHNYEKVVPTLKYFSAATFFASFLAPLTYEQLEAREGALGATYCPELLDLLSRALFLHGYCPSFAFWSHYRCPHSCSPSWLPS